VVRNKIRRKKENLFGFPIKALGNDVLSRLPIKALGNDVLSRFPIKALGNDRLSRFPIKALGHDIVNDLGNDKRSKAPFEPTRDKLRKKPKMIMKALNK